MKTKYFFWTLYAFLFLSLMAGFFIHTYFHPPIHFFWERISFFSAFYGFIGCMMIIIGSKVLGHYWLQKKEEYYDQNE